MKYIRRYRNRFKNFSSRIMFCINRECSLGIVQVTVHCGGKWTVEHAWMLCEKSTCHHGKSSVLSNVRDLSRQHIMP